METKSRYYNHLCVRCTTFPDLLSSKVRVCITYKNQISDIFPSHIPHHIWDEMTKSKIYLKSKQM